MSIEQDILDLCAELDCLVVQANEARHQLFERLVKHNEDFWAHLMRVHNYHPHPEGVTPKERQKISRKNPVERFSREIQEQIDKLNELPEDDELLRWRGVRGVQNKNLLREAFSKISGREDVKAIILLEVVRSGTMYRPSTFTTAFSSFKLKNPIVFEYEGVCPVCQEKFQIEYSLLMRIKGESCSSCGFSLDTSENRSGVISYFFRNAKNLASKPAGFPSLKDVKRVIASIRSKAYPYTDEELRSRPPNKPTVKLISLNKSYLEKRLPHSALLDNEYFNELVLEFGLRLIRAMSEIRGYFLVEDCKYKLSEHLLALYKENREITEPIAANLMRGICIAEQREILNDTLLFMARFYLKSPCSTPATHVTKKPSISGVELLSQKWFLMKGNFDDSLLGLGDDGYYLYKSDRFLGAKEDVNMDRFDSYRAPVEHISILPQKVLFAPSSIPTDIFYTNDTKPKPKQKPEVLKDGLVACVFHIYTSKGAGYSDFNHTAEAMLASEGVRFFEQRMDGRAGDGVKKAIDALPVRSGDIVVIERGGGDLNHDSFRAFKSGECIAALKNLKAMGVTVVTGVGHAKDRFGFESYVDHAEITPTAAAQRLLSILSCEQDRKGTSELEDARNVF